MKPSHRTFLFSYDFQGARYAFHIPAASEQEARLRLMQMQSATLDGELVASVEIRAGWLRGMVERFVRMIARGGP